MKGNLLLPKVATYLISGGVLLVLLGYGLSGFSPSHYTGYDHRHWYNLVDFYSE